MQDNQKNAMRQEPPAKGTGRDRAKANKQTAKGERPDKVKTIARRPDSNTDGISRPEPDFRHKYVFREKQWKLQNKKGSVRPYPSTIEWLCSHCNYKGTGRYPYKNVKSHYHITHVMDAPEQTVQPSCSTQERKELHTIQNLR